MALLDKWINQYSKTFTTFGILILFFIFNAMIFEDMHLDVRDAPEAALLWPDEGRHVRMLERIQDTGSWKLLQQSYTALHINLSYAFSWLIQQEPSPISSQNFIIGSRWVSWLSIQLFLLTVFAFATYTFSSVKWGLLALLIAIFQRFSIAYTARLHPESTMILFIALTLWMALIFIEKGKQRYLWAMVIASAFAIGSKPLCIFLLPWMALVFVATLKKHHLLTIKQFFLWGIPAMLLWLIAFLIATPYQVLHFSDWVQGVLAERETAENLAKDSSLWRWVSVFFDDAYLGPILAGGFIVALFFGFTHIWKLWKTQPQAPPDRLTLCFLLNVSWIFVGAGYFVLTSYSFIHRYLIHIHLACLMVILISGYWFLSTLSAKKKRWILPLIIILIWGGLQIQWRRAMRGLEHRERVVQQLPHHRSFFDTIKQEIPVEARILYGKRVYLEEHYYLNSLRSIKNKDRIGESLNGDWVKSNSFDYLILRSERHGEKMLQDQQMDDFLEYIAHNEHINVGVYRKIPEKSIEGS